MPIRQIQLSYRAAGATLTLLCAAAAHAAPDAQSLDSVRDAATRYLARQAGPSAAHTEFDAGALDPRLRLAPCPVPLEAFAQPNGSNTARITVGVSCPAASRWKVYVPVSVSSDVDVLVLKEAVQRGTHLTADDVQTARRHMPGFATDAVTNLAAVTGKHVRNSLPGGTPLAVDMFASDAMIRRGQQVTLVAAVGGIEVRAVGTALSEVGASGRVRVQNMSSMRIVEGVAETADRVRVNP